MNPTEWLLARNPGYRGLTPSEKEAMTNFLVLWTHFEGEVLGTRASVGHILEVVAMLDSKGLLSADTFAPALAYWRNRYLDDGQPNWYFDRLRLRENDRPEFVLGVLQGSTSALSDIAGALLIIVYRIRNNLFHGSKWNLAMKDQQQNFMLASQLLMDVFDAFEQRYRAEGERIEQ